MRTVACCLCSVSLPLPELPPSLYVDHLTTQHSVTAPGALDWLVQRTLALQHPALTSSPSTTWRLQDTLPPSVSITPVYKRKSCEAKESRQPQTGGGMTLYGRGGGGMTLYGGGETSITPKECAPAWALGCLYQCQICRVNFQTVTSFRSHLFFHNLSLAEYTEQQGEPGVRFSQHSCLVCGELVVQDPLYLSSHLASHGLSLTSYTLLHSPGRTGEDPEIVSTVSSTSKSSPCLLDTARKSLDNISDNSKAATDADEEEVESEEEMMEMMEMMPEPQVTIEEPDSELPLEMNYLEEEAEDQTELVENMFRSSDWADRCVYQCRQCEPPVVFDTHSKMSYHTKKRHNMAMKDYTTQYGRAMIHEEKHACQICGSHVLWERSSIYQHIYQVHNRVTMEQYGKLMINYQHDINPSPSVSRTAARSSSQQGEANIDWTNECEFECKLCQPGRRFNSKVREIEIDSYIYRKTCLEQNQFPHQEKPRVEND